jgi:hypothetical protein
MRFIAFTAFYGLLRIERGKIRERFFKREVP